MWRRICAGREGKGEEGGERSEELRGVRGEERGERREERGERRERRRGESEMRGGRGIGALTGDLHLV